MSLPYSTTHRYETSSLTNYLNLVEWVFLDAKFSQSRPLTGLRSSNVHGTLHCTVKHRTRSTFHLPPTCRTTQKMWFWVPAMGVFKLHNATNGWGVQGWRSVRTYPAHYNPENVFLGTCNGCLQTAECNKWVGVSRVALRAHIPLHTTSDCIVHIDDKHGRSPKTCFLTCEVHRYVHTERHPELPKHCVALCILKTSILGLQKHVF